jgi:hypothetical protein
MTWDIFGVVIRTVVAVFIVVVAIDKPRGAAEQPTFQPFCWDNTAQLGPEDTGSAACDFQISSSNHESVRDRVIHFRTQRR